jgi:hypothetical protein
MSNAQEWNGVSAPTIWKDIQFRSRLEARWAIFFDELGVEWDYEPETFVTKYGYYMPDFFLPSINKWFIVKGTKLGDDEAKKVLDLCGLTKAKAIIANGSIPEKFDYFDNETHCTNFDLLTVWEYENEECYCQSGSGASWSEHTCLSLGDFIEGGDDGYMPCFCPQCGKFDFQYEGRYERNCGCVNSDCGFYDPQNPKMLRALKKARTAYFNQETKQFTVRNF